MLTFALNYSLAGNMDSYSVKLTNILIHLINGIGIFFLTLALLRRFSPGLSRTTPGPNLVAILTTSIWLLHPLHVSTVLYSVQRMTMLSALFSIYGCLAYIYLREKLLEDNKYPVLTPVAIVLFTLLAFFSKENGALLPGLLLLIEFFCFRFRFHPACSPFYRFCLLTLLTGPVLFVCGYLGNVLVHTLGQDLPRYFFTADQRLLTQPRVLWQYVGWIYFLNPAPMSIIQDDFVTSMSLFQPVTTIISLLAWLAVTGMAIFFIKTRHILIFGLLWFLWGQILESSVLPLGMIFEHRNYLPSYGLLLGLAATFAVFYQSSKFNKPIKIILLALVFLFVPAYLLQQRAANWENAGSLILSLLHKQPDSAYVYSEASAFLDAAGKGDEAIAAIRQAQALEPRETGYIFTEAALQCHYHPATAFSNKLKDKIASTAGLKKTTAYFLHQFRVFAELCGKAGTNKDFMMDFYNKVKDTGYDRFSSVVYYGIGVIYYFSGEYQKTVDAFRTAIDRAPDWLPLEPEIRRIEANRKALEENFRSKKPE